MLIGHYARRLNKPRQPTNDGHALYVPPPLGLSGCGVCAAQQCPDVAAAAPAYWLHWADRRFNPQALCCAKGGLQGHDGEWCDCDCSDRCKIAPVYRGPG